MKGLLVLLLAIAVCTAENPLAVEFHEEEIDMVIPVTGNEFLDFMKGFLEGINEKGNINNLMKCFKSGEQIMKKIIEAIKCIAKKDIGHVIRGITMLVEAVTQLLSSLQPCMAGFNQLKKLMDALKHLNIKKIAMKILMHMGEFISLVIGAVNCFQKKDFHCAGKNIGTFLYKLLLSREATVDQAREFVKGFLEGIHEKKKVEDLEKCMKNIDPIIAKIKKAIDLFEKFTFNDLVEGFKLLKSAMQDLHKLLEPCLQGFTQVKKLMEQLKHIDIMKIVMKILLHPGAFIRDVKQCIEALKRLHMHTVGKCIGDILYRLFLSRRLEMNPILEFVAGFLVGIHEKKSMEDLLKCMRNADQILEKIKRAVKLITKMNFADLLHGLGMLFEALLELEMMLKPCLDGFDQFRRLMREIYNADIVKLIQKILRNPDPYIIDFMDIFDALDDEDFRRAGQDLGDILLRLFLEEMKAHQ